MPQEESANTPVKTFREYTPGFVHVDVKYLPQMPDQDQRTYLFAAIDRATRWVYVEILKDKSATAASGFLKRLIDKAPFKITKLLHRQRQGIYRPLLRHRRAPTNRCPRLRSGSVPLTTSNTA